MQNNLNNRVFNPNDHTSWRWNDPVLANTPISEAEARQITQIARQLGGEFSFLNRTSNPDILTAVTKHTLSETQQLIARRAAIIVTAQMKNGIPVRSSPQKPDMHKQINTFFEGLPDNLKIEEEQNTLIHKTIDSYFTAREFRVGRGKLDSYDPFPKNAQNRPEMTKANLLKFFNYMIADIPSAVAQDNYVRLKNDKPVAVNEAIYVFLTCAFEYLKSMYDGIKDSPNRNILNNLITFPIIVDAIKQAMIKGLPPKALGYSLGHVGNDLHDIAKYIIFVSELLENTYGETRRLILSSSEYVKILFEASQSSIEAQSLASGLQVNENHLYNPPRINTIKEKMHYVNLSLGLVNAPDCNAVNADFVNSLLNNKKGAQSLNYARYIGLDKSCLAKCLSTLLSANNPPSDIEQIADYIGLVGQSLYLHTTTLYSTWKILFNSFWSGYYQNSHPGEQADLILKDEAMSLAFYRAQLAGLDAPTISYILHENLDIQETSLLLNFLLDLIGAEVQGIDADFIKLFFEKVNYAAYTLNEARKKGLNPLSVGHLIKIAERASVGITNLSLAITVFSSPWLTGEVIKATEIGIGGIANVNLAINLISNHGLSSEELNTYLNLDQAPRNFNDHRYQNKSSDLLVAIIRQTLKDKEIAELRKQLGELKELPKEQSPSN